MTHIRNRFQSGSGLYHCRICDRKTRSTGCGDNEHVRLCVECFELAGVDNHLTDTGELCDAPESILERIDFIQSKGGSVSNWAALRSVAERLGGFRHDHP